MATVKVTSRKTTSSTAGRDGGTRSSSNSRQSASATGSSNKTAAPSKKVCFFCEALKEPSYTDSVTLRKFMNDRARIVSHLRSGVCSKHQRRLTKEIKHARHLALLPFIPSI